MMGKISLLGTGDRAIESSAKNQGEIYIETTGLSALSDDMDRFCSLSTSAMLARSGVPASHRRCADNYMIIKKVYGSPVIQSRLINQEKALLAKYDFNPLEYSTIKQINEELTYLKKWSSSTDYLLRNDADEIMQIRVKEMKFLLATRYALVSNEVYNGYLALERYLEDISKYCRM